LKAQSELSNKALNRALNFGILLAGALLVTSLVERYVVSKSPTGRTIQLPGVDFSRSEKTLLLFLQPDCDICIKSLPFYRKLLDKFQDAGDVTLVLITPNEPEVAREFFKSEGLSLNTVLQGKRGLLGVQLTPTLMLADSTGTLHGQWIGELSPQQETDVWSMLMLKVDR
jgi:peroxiredoxin